MKEVKLPRKTKGTSMRWKGGEEHEGEYAERTSQQTYTNALKINAFIERFEAGEMVKCFLCKHEDLSSKPDTYKKKAQPGASRLQLQREEAETAGAPELPDQSVWPLTELQLL